MPISRDPRMDRRRRLLRQSNESEEESAAEKRPSTRRAAQPDIPEGNASKKGAGYSQDVRRACSQRLVQLIPVRRRSFLAVIAISLLVPSMLLAGHYLVYVSGQLAWYGHPMATVLYAVHPQSLAAWFSGHLWLLCLGATVLTFQLRRHKLDDYTGEYRLWFWLIVTCLFASIDSTTDISGFFGMGLDPWSQLNLGWSGPAVVDSTLAVLIGMLGLRLCTELKSVPLSLVFCLLGLVAWAGSAALSREELRVEMTLPFRVWLGACLWLGGLTAIWLAALAYLRHVYIDAQQRFLLRGKLAGRVSIPIGQRLRESLPSGVTFPRLPTWRRTVAPSGTQSDLPPLTASQAAAGTQAASGKAASGTQAKGGKAEDNATSVRRFGMPSLFKRRTDTALKEGIPQPDLTVGKVAADTAAAANRGANPVSRAATGSSQNAPSAVTPPSRTADSRSAVSPAVERKDKQTADLETQSPKVGRSRFFGWLPRPKDSDEAGEYRKVNATPRSVKSADKQTSEGEADEAVSRRWLPRLSLPKVSRPKMPKLSSPKISSLIPKPRLPKLRLPSLKLPKLKLPSLRLPPPEQNDGPQSQPPNRARPLDASRALPGTDANSISNTDYDASEKGLSKAERKRLRRMQQQHRDAA